MSSLRDWLRGLPKAELHVHLEGTLTPALCERLAKRNNLQIDGNVTSLYQCDDFATFIKAFVKVISVIRQPEDVHEIAYEYLRSLGMQGVSHVELMFSPATFRHWYPDVDLKPFIEAIRDGCKAAQSINGISFGIILDMVRNLGEQAALDDISLARDCADCGVVGVGLGGDERNFPARDFIRPFNEALVEQLHRTVHAGEAAGAESINDAIQLLHAERIGHAVAAGGTSKTLELLRDHNVSVDACPTSNEITKAWDPKTVHPIKEFLELGVSVNISTDDPAFFHTTLLDEYEKVASMGLSRAELIQLARNSFSASFAPEKEKRAWLQAVDQYAQTTT